MKTEYGTITVATGTAQQRELKIINTVQAQFKDHRLVTVAEIEDGSYLVSVENPESTGRSSQKMWVSKESLIAAFGALTIYSNCKGWDLIEEYKACCVANNIGYHFSDNLKPFGIHEITQDKPAAAEGQQGSGPESEGNR